MKISINLFIPLYIGLFAFVPLILLFYIKSQKKYTKLFIIDVWQTLFLVLALFLTLFNARLSATHLYIEPPQNHSFFEFNFADGMSFHNFFINFALTIPIGVICFAKQHFIEKTDRLSLKNNPALIGLIFAIIIELLQGVLPTGRFVDPADLVFDSLVPCFTYCITELYFEFISTPLKNKLQLSI